MKGKKILALATIFAGAALVGTTFATWAVTDNADPFGIKLSPGTIQGETGINYVTLSYGERSYANISGISSGKTYLAAAVQLLADTSNSAAYTGKFNVSLINQTIKEAGARLLVNYLSVNVYTVETGQSALAKAQGSELAAADLSGLTLKTSTPITTTATDVAISCADATAKQTYVTVTLQSGLDASVLSDIHDDVVYLQMNWNSAGDDDELSATKVYFKYNTTAGKDVYCYAWNDTKTNKDYPGVLMADEGSGLYSYNLNTEYTNVLFVVKNHNETAEIAKTGDLDITTNIRQTTPCFIYNEATQTTKGAWGAVPTVLPEGWYVVGTFNSWTPSAEYKLSLDANSTTNYSIENVQLEAGAKVKVRNADGSEWRGFEGDYYTESGFSGKDSDGNGVIGAAGVYTIHFYSDSAQHNYIAVTK